MKRTVAEENVRLSNKSFSFAFTVFAPCVSDTIHVLAQLAMTCHFNAFVPISPAKTHSCLLFLFGIVQILLPLTVTL